MRARFYTLDLFGMLRKGTRVGDSIMMNREKLLEIHYSMVKVRRVEERLVDVFAQGKIPGFIHVGIGQEGVAAGVCLRVDPGGHHFYHT